MFMIVLKMCVGLPVHMIIGLSKIDESCAQLDRAPTSAEMTMPDDMPENKYGMHGTPAWEKAELRIRHLAIIKAPPGDHLAHNICKNTVDHRAHNNHPVRVGV
jgi:hypothetical protein